MSKKHAKIGDMVIGKPGKNGEPGDTLVALGLGSCIAVVIYDEKSKVAVLSHIALPKTMNIGSENQENYQKLGRFADSFIKEAINKISDISGKTGKLRAKVAGGSKMFSDLLTKDTINLGERNSEAVITELERNNIFIVSKDILGTSSRSVFYDVDTKIMTVKKTKTGLILKL